MSDPVENVNQAPTANTTMDFLNPTNITVKEGPPPTQAQPINQITPPAESTNSAPEEAKPPVENGAPQENLPTDSTENTPPEHQPIELDEQDLGDILSDATKGSIGSVSDLMQLVEENRRLKELQANPIDLFNDPEQKKIFEFMTKFKGNDYAGSLMAYAQLQALDIANLGPEDALREDFVMEQAKYGISRDQAEKMFQAEFDDKYTSKGDLAQAYLQRDSFEAKKRLDTARNEFTAPKVDAQKVEQEQRVQKAQEAYLQSAKNTLSNYKALSLTGLTEKAENDFHFEIDNVAPIEEALHDYQGFFEDRYVREGAVDTDLLAMDITRLVHQEKIDKMLFDHGMNVGKEMEIARRNNIANPNEKPASNLMGQGALKGNLAEALMGATIKN